MRTFEWLLWLFTLGWAVTWAIRLHYKRAQTLLWTLSLVIVVLHLAIEGWRSQMVATYAILGLLLGHSLFLQKLNQRPKRWAQVGRGVAVVAAIGIAGALPLLFPVFSYAKPVGAFAIGTAEYELRTPIQNRDLAFQAWYPIAPGTKGSPVRISSHPELLEVAYSSLTGLPQPLFDHLRLIKTHAIANAPLSVDHDRFPIVLFSHGPGSANRSQSLFQMEALASRGFIAIAIDHTGYASTTIFPDGHTVPLASDFSWPAIVDRRSTDMLRTWVADVRAVIDQLEMLNEHDPSGLLTGRLDLSRIGYLGASFGGSVVVQALLDEPRIRAGVAQDGKPYFSDDTLTRLRRPLLYMQSAAPYIKTSEAQLAKWGLTPAAFRMAEQDHYVRQMQLFAASGGPIYDVYIRRTNHVTFSDLDLIIGLPDSQLMNIRRAHKIINDYTLAFFEQYLNGTPEALVDGHTPSPYEEVTVASRNVVNSTPMASGQKRSSGIFEQPAGMKQVQTKSQEQ